MDRRNLMLATWRSAQVHLSLVSVELKSVGSHPPAHVAYAVRNTSLELGTVTRLTEAVNLSVIGVEVGVKAVCNNQAKQIYGVKKKQNRPKHAPIPVEHRRPAWSRSMMFLHNEQTGIDH